jgi:uncharacterized phiE125 gp8 family phage protein
MIKRATDPTALPLTMEEVRLHIKVDDDSEDASLFGYLRAETEHAEAYCNRSLLTQTWDLFLDAWPTEPVELPRPPLNSVTSVMYSTQGSTTYAQTFASTNYLVDTDSEPGRVVLKENETWPSANLEAKNPIRIRYVAGYGDKGSDIPESIRIGILLNLADRFEYRENNPEIGFRQELQVTRAAERLFAPYRVFTVA